MSDRRVREDREHSQDTHYVLECANIALSCLLVQALTHVDLLLYSMMLMAGG